jgi:hypothetical protein
LNTLRKDSKKISNYDEGKILVEDFRYYQHAFIEYFLETTIKYISNKHNSYLTLNKIVVDDIFNYSGLSNNELTRYTVYTDVVGKETKVFFRLYIPKLIYNNYYILNSHHYVPLFYIIDKPIVIKENSINLSSLFSSITLNVKNNMCTFTGQNLDLQKFVLLFLYEDDSLESKEIKIHLGITKLPEKEIIKYFNNVFSIKFIDLESIKIHIEDFFFDEYTRYLYSSCYSNDDIEVSNLSDIIKLALNMFINDKTFNFINLKNKRLCFIELLLAPLFKKAANIAYQAKKGYPTDVILIDQYAILKNFLKSSEKKKLNSNKIDKGAFNGLSGKTLYDLVNLYSSLLVHKASFVKPGMKSPPPSIADVHPTHFGKICPITVSNIKPGEMVSIIPETYLDIYGQFLNL